MICTIREHTFFRQPLRTGSQVLDLGANRGEFAREVATRFGATCLAVEPTPELAQAISAPGVRVRQAAVSGSSGEVSLFISDNPEASSITVASGDPVRVQSVPAVSLGDLLEQEKLADLALAKVDIEGAERDVFLQTPDDVLTRVAQFTVEFHVFTGALSEDDVTRIVRRLDGLGFHAIRFSAGHHNWLFFQPRRCAVGSGEEALTRHVVRNARGVSVRVARRFGRSVLQG